jgi:hypothetical protein
VWVATSSATQKLARDWWQGELVGSILASPVLNEPTYGFTVATGDLLLQQLVQLCEDCLYSCCADLRAVACLIHAQVHPHQVSRVSPHCRYSTGHAYQPGRQGMGVSKGAAAADQISTTDQQQWQHHQPHQPGGSLLCHWRVGQDHSCMAARQRGCLQDRNDYVPVLHEPCTCSVLQ